MNPDRIPIAFCITDLDPGGAERCLTQLVTGLDREVWYPTVYCLGPPGELAQVMEAAGIEVTCLGAQSVRNLSVIPLLARLLRKRRPRLLQCFLFHANLAGRIAGRCACVPIIVTGVRVAEREKRWHVWADRCTRGLVDHTVCVSRAVAEFSIRQARLRPENVSVIPNGVDFPRFSKAKPADLSQFAVPPHARVVLSVGRLHPQKGHELLIEALDPILRQQDDVHLVIAGEGPLHGQLASDVASRDLTSQIHLIGRQNDVAGLMRTATLFVLSSHWEGMPNVVLEAMSAGTAVIATPVEGVDELIVNGESGIIVNAVAANELRRGVEQCLSDAELRTGLEKSAQQSAQQSFTTQIMVQNYESVYRRLLSVGE